MYGSKPCFHFQLVCMVVARNVLYKTFLECIVYLNRLFTSLLIAFCSCYCVFNDMSEFVSLWTRLSVYGIQITLTDIEIKFHFTQALFLPVCAWNTYNEFCSFSRYENLISSLFIIILASRIWTTRSVIESKYSVSISCTWIHRL